MRTSTKLAAFGLGLVLVLGGAFAAGRLIDPMTKPGTGAGHHGAAAKDSGDAGHGADHGSDHGSEHGSGHGAAIPAGLQVAQDGYRLAPVTTSLPIGAPADFAFRILGPDGAPVTRYTHQSRA